MELPSVPRDTHPAVERRVIEGLRRMTPEERLSQAMALYGAAKELALAGIRLREGNLSVEELRVHLTRLRYGAELAERLEAYRASLR